MAYTDTNMKQVVINKVTTQQYQELLENGQINENEFYVTPDETQEITNNVGQIVAFMCTKDWVPEGCLPCDGSGYAKSSFENFWTNYLITGILQTCTYEEYDQIVAEYGSCLKFGVDSVNETFKAPLLKDGTFIQQAKSDTEIGLNYKSGLPNITGTISASDNLAVNPSNQTDEGSVKLAGDGAFSTLSNTRNTVELNSNTYTVISKTYNGNVDFNASRSNAIYGGSNTVQPQSVALRHFVVVAKGLQFNSSINWKQMIADVVHKTGDETISGNKTFTNTIIGTSMQALWADMAEKYQADADYPCGTLVQFGGNKEITAATNEVNAVISTAPGFVLNHLEDGLPIALSGKVPVRIIGKVNKFDKIVLSNIPGIGRVKQNDEQVIAIALEENYNEDEKLVMCVTKLSF